MTIGATRLQRWIRNISKVILAIARQITEPSPGVEPQQRRRIRLLSTFLLIMTVNTIACMLVLREVGGNAWMVLLATSIALILGYFVSRTRYWRAALILAVTVPALPPLASALFKPPEINLSAELMWLALPLMVASLMLALRQTILVAICYTFFIIALKAFGLMEMKDLASVVGYLIIITFSVIVISLIRNRDHAEIENQLTERLRAEKRQADEIAVLTLLGQGAELNEILNAILRLGEAHDVSIKGSVLLSDALGKRLHQVVAPSLPGEYQELMKDGITIGPNMGSCGVAAYSKKRVVIPDIEHNPDFPAEVVKVALRNGLRAVWSQPIIGSNGELLGTIANYSDKIGEPDSGDLHVIEWSARIAALAIERKNTEKAIKESEEKFSKAFHSSPDAISISRLSDGVFIEVNESYIRIIGYTRGELVGRNADDFDMWANPEQREGMLNKIRNHIIMENEEIQLRHKSGEIRTQLISSEYVSIGGEPCLLVVGTDITERKRMEESLANETIRRRILIEQSRDGIVILDQDGKVYEANRRFAEMLGYSPEETLKLNVWDWEYLYPSEQVREMIRTVDEAGDHFKTRHRRKDGTTFDVEISTNGAMFAGQKLIFCVCRDISERTHIEKALKESEEKFSKAFHSSPDAIAITMLKDGKYIEVNDSYVHFTGYTAEEIIGRSAAELNIWTKPGDRARLYRIFNEQGRVINEEFDFRMKSGEIRTWLFSAERIDVAGEPCLIGVSVDITERKRTEEALREREKRFSDIAENALEWIWEVDAKGRYTYSSPVVEKILGYKPEEILKKHFYDFFLPEEREALKKAAFEVFSQKQPIKELINRNRCKNGKTVELLTTGVPVIDEAGNLLGYRGVDTDITERRRAEQALRESEEKFSKAFYNIPEAISISRLRDGTFVEVNDTYTRITGHPREKVIGHNAKELSLWANLNERDDLIRTISTSGRIENKETQFLTKTGETRTTLLSADIINISGEPCLLIISNDISERKQAEEKLKEALASLERSSDQLAATNKEIEAFSYSVSHDLRSPLRSIDGFSQALLEDYKEQLDKKGQDYLNRLRSASQKMGELIDGILKLSRLTRSEMRHERIDLSALAREISGRLQETQPERRAEFVIDDRLTATGDPQLMRALLENLLGNAWKFTGKKPNAKIEFGVERQNGKQAYFIRDNGAGFDMTYADKLFGAFQRLHEVTDFPGTGIGLATVQRIIHRHGGTIWAEGKTGKGATFHFTLD